MADRRDVKAYMVPAAKAPVQDWTYSAIPLGPNDVEIKIECCGVCHSDLHQAHNDWGAANYPLVPGHEIIGNITAVGSEVKDLKVGDRVGVSPQASNCKECDQCKRGQEQLCAKMKGNYGSPTGDPIQPYTCGGFAEYTRISADWAFKIPDALPSIQAAPLLCAGLTTWMPFVTHKIKAGDKVGIIGIGGLGHIALQWASKLGCHVTAISSSADKAEEAKKFGAQAFLSSSDAKAMQEANGTFDFLLSTVSANGVNWTSYLWLLKPEGVLCCVGMPQKMEIAPAPLVMRKLSITGSLLASRAEIMNMLEFAAKHGVVAATEELAMTADNCNAALKRVEENKARYRVVLINEAHKKA